MQYRVVVSQGDEEKQAVVAADVLLIDAVRKAGFLLEAYCGGQGTCGKCRVRVEAGLMAAPHKQEEALLSQKELDSGVRLACLTTVQADMRVVLADMSGMTKVAAETARPLELDSGFRKCCFTLSAPTLEDQRDFLSRAKDACRAASARVDCLGDIASWGPEQEMTGVVTPSNQLARVEQGNTERCLYGLAVDIGTTTTAVYLMDLTTGTLLEAHSFQNPQRAYGADVIARIHHARQVEGGLEELQRVVIAALNEAIVALARRHGIATSDIWACSAAGNTVMLHLFLGINPETIAQAPFIPVFTQAFRVLPGALGLNMNPRGSVYLLPCVSGYIGGDIIADMLAVDGFGSSSGYELLVDIGTNGELVLGSREQLLACSTAAGPAFEGANISRGMGGVRGAISRFTVNPDGSAYQCETIGNEPARGICGAGLVDIVGQLVRFNVILENGSIAAENGVPSSLQGMLVEDHGAPAIRLAVGVDNEPVLLTQKDIRELQLAKGAIAAGIRVLVKKAGITSNDIEKVFLAGGFGSFISAENACLIGMIPRALQERIVRIGNGAGTGAQMYLLSQAARRQADRLCAQVQYVELSSGQDFQTEFMQSMMFGPAD